MAKNFSSRLLQYRKKLNFLVLYTIKSNFVRYYIRKRSELIAKAEKTGRFYIHFVIILI